MIERASVWANLDCESEWDRGRRPVPSAPIARALARWSSILRLLPGLERATLWEPGAPAPAGALIAWGATAIARAASASVGDPAVARWANDKRTSAALEARFFETPAWGPTVVETLSELRAAIKACPHDWLAKHPFGVAGRGRTQGRAGELSTQAARWADKHFAGGGALVFEPRARIERECSLHFEIGADAIRWIGAVSTEADGSGTPRAFAPGVCESIPLGSWRAALEAGPLCALQERGYRGPVGVDAFVGALGEGRWERAMCEINARWTFGRIALALARLLAPGAAYRWEHPAKSARGGPKPAPLEGQPDAGVWRLPEWADPAWASGTIVRVGALTSR